MGDTAVVVGVCGAFKPFSRSSRCVVNEIQLQRQAAGIASRYYGRCSPQPRHAAFACGTDRFRLGGGRFAWRRSGGGSSRTHNCSRERSGVVLAKKSGPCVSTRGRAFSLCIAALWQLGIDGCSRCRRGRTFSFALRQQVSKFRPSAREARTH